MKTEVRPEVDELLSLVRRRGKTLRYIWTLLWLDGWRHLFSVAEPEQQIRAAWIVLEDE